MGLPNHDPRLKAVLSCKNCLHFHKGIKPGWGMCNPPEDLPIMEVREEDCCEMFDPTKEAEEEAKKVPMEEAKKIVIK